MERYVTSAERIWIVLGAFIGWFAVGLQFYLILANRVASVPETMIRFFSFFTILTNTLVAVYFLAMTARRKTGLGVFFSRPGVSTAITIYILVVGLVYQFVLRSLWDPTGWQKLADELLHSVMPVYMLIYWLVFVNKYAVDWKYIPGWLLYPLGYLAFILLRGALSGFYPYPFVNVSKLGYPAVLQNSVGLTIVFLVLSLLAVFLSKRLSRRSFRRV